EVVRAREYGRGKFAPEGQAFVQLEADHRSRAHLDRGHANLAVALREMRVAGREEGTSREYREVELGALGKLLHIEIAAVFARRQGAQPGEAAGPGWHRTGRIGREGEATLVDHPLLARGPL